MHMHIKLKAFSQSPFGPSQEFAMRGEAGGVAQWQVVPRHEINEGAKALSESCATSFELT